MDNSARERYRMADEDQTKRVSTKELKSGDLAEDLMSSPAMTPYLRLAEAMLQIKPGEDPVTRIAELPLEERYVWRVASALKWAFADFDNLSVAVDRKTLRVEDRQKLLDVLRDRPIQFCLFLKTLLGSAEMQRIMVEAIKVAREFP